MTFIPKNAILFFFGMLFLAPYAGGQAFHKERIYEMAREAVRNAFRHDPAELKNLPPEAFGQPAASRPAEEAVVSWRDNVELGISRTAEETESEVHAAVNPTDTQNIIVAGMRFGQGGLLGAELTFPIYYTRDFGQSWQLSSFDGVSDRPGAFLAGGGDPIVVFGTDGTAYLSWLTLTLDLTFQTKVSLNWAISNDGGATWKRQADVIDEGKLEGLLIPTGGRFVDKQWMAVDHSGSPYRDNIYIAYAEINLSDTTYQILVKRKEAGSSTISTEPVVVSPADFVFAQFTSVDVDRRGTVHLMFAGARAEDSVASLYHVRSTDGGRTFSAPVRISPFNLQCFPPNPEAEEECPLTGIDPNRVYPCPHLRVDQSGGPYDGALYAVWTADGRSQPETAGVDIYFSRSTDGGATWSDARVLNDNDDTASHQFFPSLAVNENGVLVVTWYDRREDTANINTKYYMTYSEDGGATFASDFAVSGQASDFSVIGQSNGNFGVGEYTQVVTTRGYAIPFWADGRGNDGNIEIFTTAIPLGEGLPTSTPAINTITDKFSVKGPYPNPASDRVQLDVVLQQPAHLSIDLFSASGQLLRRLPARGLGSGSHTVELDVKGLPAGYYLLLLRTEYGFRTVSLGVTG